ncbi:MAG: helix-turn-helix transcriptional regulator [Alphaproteobacteria bacterium]|nr:helix-turn-helix transcriptional regulator [Alphaproteobacteria bacterium]
MLKSKISSIAKKQNKSPTDIIKQTGLSRDTVFRLLRPADLENVSLRTLLKISKMFNCKIKNLYEEID